MSTKTTFKRVALVAVVSLGFGVLSSVAPASAASALGDVSTPQIVTLDTAVTSLSGRVGQLVTVPLTATTVAATNASTALATLTIAAAMTSQPASSSIYLNLASAGSAIGTALTLSVNTPLTFAGAATNSAATNVSGTNSTVAAINYASATQAIAATAVTSDDIGTITFTPIVAGTYTFVAWQESSRTVANASGTGLAGMVSTDQPALSGSESYQTFTVNVTSAPTAVSITTINSTAVKYLDGYGSLLKVCLKDATGAAAILSPGEFVTLTPSLAGDITYVNKVAAVSAPGAAYNLSSADFSSASGCAWVNVGDGTAETISVQATIGGANASTSLTFRTVTTSIAPVPYNTTATGYVVNTTTLTNLPIGVASVTYRNTGTYVAATPSYNGFSVTDTTGYVTNNGVTTGLRFDPAVTVGSTGYASYTVSTTTAATGTAAFTIDDVVAAGTLAGHAVTNTSLTTASGTPTLNVSVISAVAGATTSITATLKSNYGLARSGVTLSASVVGRNPTSAAQNVVTDALGNATFTFADANSTSSLTSDAVTITGGLASATATILYGSTNVPSTVTLTSTGDTDVIAGTTKTDIDAGYAGATGVSATASAVVKNAAGSLLAGVPVTFVVTGLVGAEVHTSLVTVYTNSIGVAASKVSSYAAGKATITATAGTVTATDDLYFAQGTPDEARTIAISAAGGLVTATVKDRYGNLIKDVVVNATRTGTGYFGAGVSTATGNTDANGVVEFNFVGSGTVKVAFSSTTYGQSYAAAGYDADAVNGTAITAAVAGTSVTAQKGLGAALAPVGINSASLAVEGANVSADNAQAAADAAAEATDAANAATDAANAAAEAADAATAAAQDAADAVAALSTQVSEMVNALKKQITALTNLVIKIQKKVKA